MNEQALTDLLERAGSALPVPPAPVPEMVSTARRRRRTRTWGLVGASSVAAAVIVALAVFIPSLTGGGKAPESLNAGPIPAGTRLVGIGHVAVAVPQSWATNKEHCGTPQKDTVIIDLGGIDSCLATLPENVDSVILTTGEPEAVGSYQPVSVSGVEAKLGETGCTDHTPGHVLTCSGAVYVPSEDVTIRAESSTNADVVDQLLQHIYVLTDRVAVPGYMSFHNTSQQHATAKYLQSLSDAGLVADIRFVRPSGWPPGFISGVSPTVGQMVATGTQVRVDVARKAQKQNPSVSRGNCEDASLSSDESAANYVRHYIACLNHGTQQAAQQYWVDFGLPKRGTTAKFYPTQHQCRVNRDSFGMGTNAYRFSIAVPGRYSETPPTGKATHDNDAVFIVVRGSRQQRWAILERTDSASDQVHGAC